MLTMPEVLNNLPKYQMCQQLSSVSQGPNLVQISAKPTWVFLKVPGSMILLAMLLKGTVSFSLDDQTSSGKSACTPPCTKKFIRSGELPTTLFKRVRDIHLAPSFIVTFGFKFCFFLWSHALANSINCKINSLTAVHVWPPLWNLGAF